MNAAGKEKIYMTIAWNFCIRVIADITCWPLVGFLPEDTSPTNCLFFWIILLHLLLFENRGGSNISVDDIWVCSHVNCTVITTEKHCHGVKGRGCVGMNQERTKTNQPFIGSGSLPADRTHASRCKLSYSLPLSCCLLRSLPPPISQRVTSKQEQACCCMGSMLRNTLATIPEVME